MGKSFGFDLDNTLIDYSAAVDEYCRRKGLKPCSNVRILREYLGKNSTSDHEWQLAQSWLYTEGLQFAQAGLGSDDLCKYLIEEKYKLFIISHKTSHTPHFCGRMPLRELANNWIKKSLLSNYFNEPEQIFYEPTRKLKVERIRELRLKYFVDDLEEVFYESEFPFETKSFLIYKSTSQNSRIKCVSNFNDIKKSLSNGF